MSVGQRLPVVSEQIFSDFSVKQLVSPAFEVTSSSPAVVEVEFSTGRTAWIQAKSVGEALLHYRTADGSGAMKETKIEVIE